MNFTRLATRSSSSEESCTVAQKTNHDMSEHIFTACHLGEAETTYGECDRLCHVLTRNKSEGINGTPIQHHKIQRLRAPLLQHPSMAQGRNQPTQRTRLFLWSREPNSVCRPCSRTPFGRFTTE